MVMVDTAYTSTKEPGFGSGHGETRPSQPSLLLMLLMLSKVVLLTFFGHDSSGCLSCCLQDNYYPITVATVLSSLSLPRCADPSLSARGGTNEKKKRSKQSNVKTPKRKNETNLLGGGGWESHHPAVLRGAAGSRRTRVFRRHTIHN